MTRSQRTAFLIAAATVGALALSGAVAFRPPKRREQVGEGSSFGGGGGGGFSWPWSTPLAPTMPAPAPTGAKLDEQYRDAAGKKVSIIQAKKPATGKGPDGIDNRTRGAGTGTGLGLDG